MAVGEGLAGDASGGTINDSLRGTTSVRGVSPECALQRTRLWSMISTITAM